MSAEGVAAGPLGRSVVVPLETRPAGAVPFPTPTPGGHAEFRPAPPTLAVTRSVASTREPKFRVFPAFGWGWGGRGSEVLPGCAVRDAAGPAEGTPSRARTPGTGIARPRDLGAPRGPARKGPRRPRMPGRPLSSLPAFARQCLRFGGRRLAPTLQTMGPVTAVLPASARRAAWPVSPRAVALPGVLRAVHTRSPRPADSALHSPSLRCFPADSAPPEPPNPPLHLLMHRTHFPTSPCSYLTAPLPSTASSCSPRGLYFKMCKLNTLEKR